MSLFMQLTPILLSEIHVPYLLRVEEAKYSRRRIVKNWPGATTIHFDQGDPWEPTIQRCGRANTSNSIRPMSGIKHHHLHTNTPSETTRKCHVLLFHAVSEVRIPNLVVLALMELCYRRHRRFAAGPNETSTFEGAWRRGIYTLLDDTRSMII